MTRLTASGPPRPGPVCGTAASAGRVVLEERFDPALLDRFAFASRKLPEFVHRRLSQCPICDVLFASPAPDSQALANAYREADYHSGEESLYWGQQPRAQRAKAPPSPDRRSPGASFAPRTSMVAGHG